MSVAAETVPPVSCSGAMYAGVPMKPTRAVMEVSPSFSTRCSARAMPKSVIDRPEGRVPGRVVAVHQEDVRRLEVPVHDVLQVHGLEPVGQLA